MLKIYLLSNINHDLQMVFNQLTKDSFNVNYHVIKELIGCQQIFYQVKDTASPGEEKGSLSERQVRVMQSLGLIAPAGSPFRRNGFII